MKYYHLFDNYYYLPDYKCFVSTISLIECVKLPSEFTSLFTDIQHSASNNERSLLATSAYLILSDICNLQCSYCYSSASTEGRLMSLEIAKSVVRFVVRNAIIKKFAGVPHAVVINYMGGGEPTINWKVIENITYYARDLCKKHSLPCYIGIQTNGQLNSDDRIYWLFSNLDKVGLSLDGLSDIQNIHRPRCDGMSSFLPASRFIDIHKQYKNVKFTVRSTVSSISLIHLGEFCDWLAQNNVSKLHIEPLSICGRALKSGTQPPLYNDFVDEYELLKETYANNLNISTSMDYDILHNSWLCSGYLGNAVFVNTNGDMTCCTEVTNPTDKDFSRYCIGKVDEENVHYYNDAIKLMNDISLDKCKECFLYNSCNNCVIRYEREKHDKNENYTCLIKQELALRTFKRLLTMSEYVYMKHKIAKIAINKDGIINLYFLTNAQ